MVNQYSVGIHEFINKKMEENSFKEKNAQESNKLKEINFLNGQLYELKSIREFLSQRVDLKTQEYF